MGDTGLSEIVFAVANLGIFFGYCFTALVVVPAMQLRYLQTQVGGVLFFITCGLTHLELAAHSYTKRGLDAAELFSWHMLTIHVVQVVAVWLFISGLYREYVVPYRRRQRQGRME